MCAAAPHRGDLAVNVALGITLIWLPLSIAGACGAQQALFRRSVGANMLGGAVAAATAELRAACSLPALGGH